MSRLAESLAGWIAARVKEAGLRGAVLGLSGGVDSAVTAALCKMALGERVLGLIMPCGSDRADEEDATYVAAKLGVATATVRLDGPFRALVEELDVPAGLACANLKPRLRMAVLYYYANSTSYMVVGTGNKTELAIGYFTKYGDGGVDILPLGDLYKTQVWALAREICIPGRIVEKPPSAGLWEGQTDEGEMGIAYEDLDRVLEAIESGRTDGIAPGSVALVNGMVRRSSHKRICAQICEPAP